jgi:cell division protein FtsB
MKKVRYSNKNRRSGNSANDNIVNKILNSGIGKIVLIGVSILMILSVYRSFRQMGQKISLLKQAEREVSELRIDNLELSLQREEAGSITNLEKEARDRLNYGKEDEVVFVIDEELLELGQERVQAILNPVEDNSDIDTLKEWTDFILNGY